MIWRLARSTALTIRSSDGLPIVPSRPHQRSITLVARTTQMCGYPKHSAQGGGISRPGLSAVANAAGVARDVTSSGNAPLNCKSLRSLKNQSGTQATRSICTAGHALPGRRRREGRKHGQYSKCCCEEESHVYPPKHGRLNARLLIRSLPCE
jgi:hypothetical protein